MVVPYNKEFYARFDDGVQRSATIIVPLLMELVKIESVLDVGCGIGTWLSVFAQSGVTDYLGVDGDYVDRTILRIPVDRFKAMDLRQEIDFGRRFDLACSLEVAEHLPPSAADSFIAALVSAAPLVLFSAAIPGQGGTDHINEQWQSYWVQRFAQHGYEAVDCIRPKVSGNPEVSWWYQQNILLFCGSSARPTGFVPASSVYAFDHVHPHLWERALAGPQTGQEAMAAISAGAMVLAGKVRQRFERIGGAWRRLHDPGLR